MRDVKPSLGSMTYWKVWLIDTLRGKLHMFKVKHIRDNELTFIIFYRHESKRFYKCSWNKDIIELET